MTMQNDPHAAFIESARALKTRIIPSRAETRQLIPVADGERRQRALNTGHRYAEMERQRKPSPQDSRAYVPELSARLDDDPKLTDGARRCARDREARDATTLGDHGTVPGRGARL